MKNYLLIKIFRPFFNNSSVMETRNRAYKWGL